MLDIERRVIVCGGRHYNDFRTLHNVLNELPPDTIIVHGACRTGADNMAEIFWARDLGRETERHPADWTGPCHAGFCPPRHRKEGYGGRDYCPFAGFWRNQVMADLGARLCLAFPGASGTFDMVKRANAAAIPVSMIGLGMF